MGQFETIFEIRKTEPDQLDAVMDLYARARTFMAEHGNPEQWGTSYPPRDMIEDDIRDGNSYVCMAGGEIAAAFFFLLGEDPSYKTIRNGRWLNDNPYGVVHRIASAGIAKGAASHCLAWALSQCGNLRIDTYEDNRVMQNLLKKNGFSYCGIIRHEDADMEFLAYQKSAE